MSQLTTHILDTTLGTPAGNVQVTLFQQQHEWLQLATGFTDDNGRITDLLERKITLPHGIYKLRFDTLAYFEANFTHSFYPFVEIVFYINSNAHYHVPLLLSPFGYSTYRGS